MEEKWFDSEFLTEKEKEEIDDAMMAELGKLVMQEETKAAVVNPERCKQLAYTVGLLKKMIKGSGAKVSYKMNHPFVDMGAVYITGKNLRFEFPEYFTAAAKIADNLDVYAKTDGTVCVCFTFHGLTKKAE